MNPDSTLRQPASHTNLAFGFIGLGASCALLWAITIWFVDPSGEFLINDDWSFVRMMEALSEGRISATGWGQGGPAAIVHVLWGRLFTSLFGASPTTFRWATLVMSISLTFGLMGLFRRVGAPPWKIAGAVLVCVMNPLFLAESFSFMTDITFTAFVVFCLLFSSYAESRPSFIPLMLVCALAGILTRQIGIVLPLAFIAASLLRPPSAEGGRKRAVVLAVLCVFLPWFAFEVFLAQAGSTPVTQHDVFRNILRRPLEKGFADYLVFLLSQVLVVVLYTGLFLAPLTATFLRRELKSPLFRRVVALLCIVFVVIEAGLTIGWFDLPKPLHRNVIFDLGLGPVLLKDVYILKIERFAAMPTQMYYGCVFIAAISACIVWARFYRFTVDLFNRTREQAPFVALMSLIAAILYMGIIIITGFHDRYLIPLIILWTVWAVTTDQDSHTRPEAALFIGAAALVATLSIVMMRDFMDIKRAVSQAHNYVITETHTNPCDFDGGFEFNGFHCYRKDFVQREGLSWWWVREEKYLVALGPLPSYTVVKTFPFRRRIGSDGAVHVLEPVGVAR